MLKALFNWFDANPSVYWGIGTFATVLLLGWLFRAIREPATPGEHRRATDWAVALLFLAVILAWRWPPLLHINEFNPDEAQRIAGALTFGADLLPYRSVDGTTSGPLNTMALLPLHWLGIPQDYFNARLTGLLMVWSALVAAYAIVRSLSSPAVAALGLLPGVFFFATASDTDFIHYSSEHCPIFLGWLGAWLIWRGRPAAAEAARLLRPSWLLGGCVIGLLPWAKLQAGPIALAFAAWGAVLGLSDTQRRWPARFGQVALLAAATLLPTLGFLALFAATGQFEQFWLSYIVNNLHYTQLSASAADVLRELWRLSQFTKHVPAFLLGPVVLIVLGLLWSAARLRLPHALHAAALLFLAAAGYAILAPRHGFHHYLLFGVVPLAFWAALGVAECFRDLQRPLARSLAAAFVVALTAGPLLHNRVHNRVPPIFGHFAEYWRQPRDEPGRLVRSLARPGDRIALWGWWCHLHVETGLPQATREGQTERQMRDIPLRDTFYRPRYLADIRHHRPAFFVDAVGPGAFCFEDRHAWSHETFPELRAYVADNYRLVQDFGKARIYIRNDR